MPCELETILSNACSSGIGKMSNSEELLKVIAQLLCDAASGSGSPMVYRALISQTGVSAPTAIVLENSLGGTPTFSYQGVGVYRMTLTGAFTLNRTFALILAAADAQAGDNIVGISRISNDAMIITVGSIVSGVGQDGWLDNYSVEVLVYP